MILQKGNVKPSVSDRSVYRPLGGNQYRGKTDQCPVRTCQGWTLAAEEAVYGIMNDCLCCGKRLQGLAIHALLPENTDETALKKLMQEIKKLCDREHVSVDRAQVTVSSHVDTLIMSVAATEVSLIDKFQLFQSTEKCIMDIVVVGCVGSQGAAVLSREKKEQLLTRYTESFLEKATQLYPTEYYGRYENILADSEIFYCKQAGEGGIFAALWDMTVMTQKGMDISLKRIPIKQHTIEIGEFFRLNPYQLLSGGSLLLLCKKGESLANNLQTLGIPAAVIGQTTNQQDKIIRYDDEIRHLEPSKMDEIYKISQ